jgi:hypothetical protein
MDKTTVTLSQNQPDAERIRLALNAVEELEFLMRAQAAYIREQGAPDEMMVLRGNAMRGLQLVSVAMSSLGDMAEPVADIQTRLIGPA